MPNDVEQAGKVNGKKFEDLVPNQGFLTDRDILLAADHGFLLEKGTWEKPLIRHASYTLRLGDRVEIARASDNVGAATKEFRIVKVAKDVPVELRPGDTALLYSFEQLRVPDCVVGFTVARGLLFAEALSPENTYVDPGFSGSLYTTVTNISNRVVALPHRMTLARVFFYRLGQGVESPFRSGVSLGISQELASLRVIAFGTAEECRKATDQTLLDSIRQIPFGGNHLAESLSRQFKYLSTAELRLFFLAVIWPILLVVANNSQVVKDNIGAFGANVAASIVATLICVFAPKLLTLATKFQPPS